ncbi:MAG: 4Fe-4S binding protein [Campylobacterales bacterium]|nr:4Fe-4S binding protein [Campylobacterales bacterium]
MGLKFDASSCVRVSSFASNCQKCIDICPVQTIKLTSNLPSFTPIECIECGGCVGVCPTSSFSLTEFNITDFLFEYFNEPKVLSCKQNIPCLGVFNPEELISLALGSDKEVVLDIGHCAACEIKERLYPLIKANIEEANFILSSFSSKQIKSEDIKLKSPQAKEEETSRRDFLHNLKPINAIKHKVEFDEIVNKDELKSFGIDDAAISKIKNKKIPDKRKLFFALLKQEERPKRYETIDSNDISFSSQKYIDQNCTNCQICYRICPTGALSSSSNFSEIHFDAMLCVKCHLCHDVCAQNAIHMQPSFEIKEFFEPTGRVLANFVIKRCDECGNSFTYTGGDVICPRCRTEEDEAIMLHQIARNNL